MDDIVRDNEALVSDIQARAANGENYSDLLGKLYTDNLPLMEALCKDFKRLDTKEDALQELFLTLRRAALKYRPDGGSSFAGFFILLARRDLAKFTAEQAGVVRIPEGVYLRWRKIEAARRRLLQQLEREPTKKELATETGFNVRQINEAAAAANAVNWHSLDAPVSGIDEEDGPSVAECLPDTERPFDAVLDVVDAEGKQKAWDMCAKVLPEKHMRLLALLYKDKKTLTDIACEWGVSRQAVFSLQQNAMQRLSRGRLLKQLLELDEDVKAGAYRRARLSLDDRRTGDVEALVMCKLEQENLLLHKAVTKGMRQGKARREFMERCGPELAEWAMQMEKDGVILNYRRLLENLE